MWITVFKSGTHKNNAGVEQSYDNNDLQEIANIYNNQPADERHDAPLIPGGHEKIHYSDGEVMIKPSMGWVEQLKANGEYLLAKINPTQKFNEAVKGKYYNKLSIALKENRLLDHIALLGAVKPALKGLPNLDSSFTMNVSDMTEQESYEFKMEQEEPSGKPKDEFEEEDNNNSINNYEGETMSKMTIDTDKLIEYIKSELGDEAATKVQSKLEDFKYVEENPEGNEPTEGSQSQTEFSEEQTKKFNEQQKKIQQLETKLRLSEHNEFVSSTNIPKGLTGNAINILEIAHNAETSNFSVKDDEGKDTTPTGAVKSLLKSWPKPVDLGESEDVNADNYSESDEGKEVDDAVSNFNKSRKK